MCAQLPYNAALRHARICTDLHGLARTRTGCTDSHGPARTCTELYGLHGLARTRNIRNRIGQRQERTAVALTCNQLKL